MGRRRPLQFRRDVAPRLGHPPELRIVEQDLTFKHPEILELFRQSSDGAAGTEHLRGGLTNNGMHLKLSLGLPNDRTGTTPENTSETPMISRQFPRILVVISRRDVENAEIQPTQKVLERLKSSLSCDPLSYCGAVDLSVDGYTDDERELYEIPEVCEYLDRLSVAFPYLFYFLSTDTQGLKMITACVCGAQRVGGDARQTVMDNQSVMRFMGTQFAGLNKLFHEFDLDEHYPKLNEQTGNRVMHYLGV